MKKLWTQTFLVISLSLSNQIPVKAQSTEITQLTLNIEKLAQMKKVLQEMKNGYRMLLGGYNTVREVTKGNFNLHRIFLEGLMSASPAVKNYRRVSEIIQSELLLVNECQRAIKRFRRSSRIGAKELTYFSSIYERLLSQSLQNIQQLTMVITQGSVQMNDADRIQAIDRIYEQLQDKIHFLRNFNTQITLLELLRKGHAAELQQVEGLYKGRH